MESSSSEYNLPSSQSAESESSADPQSPTDSGAASTVPAEEPEGTSIPSSDGMPLPDGYELIQSDTETKTENGSTYIITTNYYLPKEEEVSEDEIQEEETQYLVDSEWSDMGIVQALTLFTVSLAAGFVLSSLPALIGYVIGSITKYIPKDIG